MQDLQTTADAAVLTARIAALINAKRPVAARLLLAAVRRLQPSSPDLAQLAARVAIDEGRLEQALEELDAAVAQDPEHGGLRKFRADLHARMNNRRAALADAAEAVVLEPGDPSAKALLGVLLLEDGRISDAIACLDEAVAAEPANPLYRQGLAAAQEANGDVDEALATLTEGIAAAPRRIDLRNEAMLLSIRHRDFAKAYQLSEEARIANTADACSFGLMGHALSSLGDHVKAADAYGEALKLGPEDPYVRHLVAASGSLPGASRAPVEYVRTIFDGYADSFECHLVSLGYRVPGLMHAAVARLPTVASGQRLDPALDLGCGTGLIALALSDLPVGPLVGVDLSPRMLAYAATKQLYAELHESDLLEFLVGNGRRWRLILAADVLVYFGTLDAVLTAVHAVLEQGGWLIFTVEELLPHDDGTNPGNGDWALQRQGRYAHTMAYVHSAAQHAGLVVRTLERQVLRFEHDAPVAGIFAILERPDHDV